MKENLKMRSAGKLKHPPIKTKCEFYKRERETGGVWSQKKNFRAHMRGGSNVPKESRNMRKIRIKQALLNQLETSGKTDDYWHDLVLDYLAFWEIKEKLKVDIERNGIMTTVQNGSQVFRKRNDALVELPKIHKRMTDVLEVLDIKPVEGEPDGDDY